VEGGVEHGHLRELGPGGPDRLDALQVGRVLQRRQRGGRPDRGDHLVVDQDRGAEPVAPVHHPVARAEQDAAREDVQDRGDDGGPAAVRQGYFLVPRMAQMQHGLGGADFLGEAIPPALAGVGGDQGELHRRAARVEDQYHAAGGCHAWDATGAGLN
jgi:hypothetical protein